MMSKYPLVSILKYSIFLLILFSLLFPSKKALAQSNTFTCQWSTSSQQCLVGNANCAAGFSVDSSVCGQYNSFVQCGGSSGLPVPCTQVSQPILPNQPQPGQQQPQAQQFQGGGGSLKLPGGMTIADPLDSGTGKINSNSSIADIVSALVPYVMAIAGIILFLMLIAGGFALLTSAGNPDSIKKGQGMIVSSLIGFAIVFTAYWLMQVVEIIFGLKLGFGGN